MNSSQIFTGGFVQPFSSEIWTAGWQSCPPASVSLATNHQSSHPGSFYSAEDFERYPAIAAYFKANRANSSSGTNPNSPPAFSGKETDGVSLDEDARSGEEHIDQLSQSSPTVNGSQYHPASSSFHPRQPNTLPQRQHDIFESEELPEGEEGVTNKAPYDREEVLRMVEEIKRGLKDFKGSLATKTQEKERRMRAKEARADHVKPPRKIRR
jgi:hypothetical protein